ncbi:uncharacterized protein LOC121054497, partial [Oryza brachyantha]|uniref:uncharacterized protein LOC121054497 n=1 Tax=Oryza brachyantha TaxID=4533 RepID=UPI001ADC2BCF
MRENAPPFSIMKYIWYELQQIILDASRGLAYAPYLHLMIETVTGLRFVADCAHRSYKPILPKKVLSAIFEICKKTTVKVKSNERKINQLPRESGHKIPSESEDEVYEDPFAAYEAARTIVRDVGASSSCPAPIDSDVDTEEEEYVEEDDEESEVPAAESPEEAESDDGEAADDEEGDAQAEGEPEAGRTAARMKETAQPEVSAEAEATESDGIQTEDDTASIASGATEIVPS